MWHTCGSHFDELSIDPCMHRCQNDDLSGKFQLTRTTILSPELCIFTDLFFVQTASIMHNFITSLISRLAWLSIYSCEPQTVTLISSDVTSIGTSCRWKKLIRESDKYIICRQLFTVIHNISRAQPTDIDHKFIRIILSFILPLFYNLK